MNGPKTRTLPPLNRVAPGELEQALLHWEELEAASLVTLAAHPESGPRLAVLRAAEAWLAEGGAREGAALGARESTTCPPAEDLYNLGRGPGFTDLPGDRRGALLEHVKRCEDCRVVVDTLASPPPLPVDLGLDLEKPEIFRRPTPARRLPGSRTWLPFLVAAGLAGVFLLPPLLDGLGGLNGGLPEHPQYRGAQSSALLFPRGKLLAGTALPLLFELNAVPEAASYRIEVYANGASQGAFEEGQRVQILHSETPLFTGPLLDGKGLSAGSYTWKAFAEVNQLDQPLGARDFVVQEDGALANRLVEELALKESSETRIELIRELDARGYASDARRLARLLPESSKKTEFLRAPGR